MRASANRRHGFRKLRTIPCRGRNSQRDLLAWLLPAPGKVCQRGDAGSCCSFYQALMVPIPPPPPACPGEFIEREIDAMLRQRDSALLCRELSLFPFYEQPQTVSVSVACPVVRLPCDSQYEPLIKARQTC